MRKSLSSVVVAILLTALPISGRAGEGDAAATVLPKAAAPVQDAASDGTQGIAAKLKDALKAAQAKTDAKAKDVETPTDSAEAQEATPEADAEEDSQTVMTHAEGDAEETVKLVEGVDRPEATKIASASGAMTYAVPIRVPEYRGLEPKLALSYNSADRMYGDSSPVIGVGWRMAGISSIERVAETGGVPSYNDAFDMLRLDGQDLLACKDAAATNGYARAYPAQFHTSRRSASCASGGKFVTLQDDFRRITLTQSDQGGEKIDTFIVTDKSGIEYVYKPAGVLAGLDLPNTHLRYDLAYKRKFLLAEVRDRQRTRNVVTYTYAFGPLADGLAERIARIDYASFSVRFHYQIAGGPRKTFATGINATLGKQDRILSAIAVYDRTQGIRAYRIAQQMSETTYQRRLRVVQEYGNNFEITDGVVTAGRALPGYVFDHSDGALTLARRTYAGKEFHGGTMLADIDDDGRTDINVLYSRFQGKYSKPKGSFEVQNNRGITDTALPLPTNDASSFNSTRMVYESEYQYVWGVVEPAHWETEYYQSFECQTVVISYYPYQTDYQCGWVTKTRQKYVADRYGYSWQWVRWWADYPYGSAMSQTVMAPVPVKVAGTAPHYISVRHESSYDNSRYSSTQTNQAKLLLQRQEGDAIVTKKTVTHNIGGCKYGGERGQDPVLIGNFDRDRAPEVAFGETIFDVTDTDLVSSSLTAGFGSYCETAHDGAAAVDLDGDGVDEILAGAYAYWNENGTLVRRDMTNTPFSGRTLDDNGDENRVIRFGDINGDGAADAIVHVRGQGVTVSLGTGRGFLPPEEWISKATVDSFGFAGDKFGVPRTQLVDMNGDGLDDLVLHDGYESNTHKLEKASDSRSARVFLSRVTGFALYGGANAVLPDFLGVGDVDGDGQMDVVSEGTDGVVYFNDAGPRNLVVNVLTPLKGEVAVRYMSTRESTAVVDDQVPGVSHVVRQIDVSDGRGQVQTSYVDYAQGRFDWRYRRGLGWGKVTTLLPRLGNETADSEQVDFYHVDHVGRAGLMYASRRDYDGVKQRQSSAVWNSQTTGTGPFTNTTASVTEEVRHADRVIRTYEAYLHNEFGERTQTVQYGAVRADGSDIDPADNVILKTAYVPNRTDYIVDRPVYQWKGAGETISGDRSTWVTAQYLHYDEEVAGDRSWNVEPIRGNLTSVRIWNGNAEGNIALRRDAFNGYDDAGNLVSETNGRGHVTTHTYDGIRALFRTSTTNALGQREVAGWYHRCQAQNLARDVNGLETVTEFDELCRVTKTTKPNGAVEATSYVLGDAANQYVETRTRSASTLPEMANTVKRTYTDGLGRTWKEAVSGRTSAAADLVYTLKAYDKRNNVIWESIPLTEAEAATGAVGQDWRATYVFDPQDRQTRIRMADGQTTDTVYHATLDGSDPLLAIEYTKRMGCLDTDAASLCEQTRSDFDYRGNLLRFIRWDFDATDTNQIAANHRSTYYDWDADDRLVRVRDPHNTTWTFTYDGYGNRLTEDDPSLGLVTMTYDAADNLVTRTDAKGQIVRNTWDALNRVTEKRVTGGMDGPKITRSTYDEPRANAHNIGRLSTVTLGTHTIEYDYDRMGEILREYQTIDGDRRYQIHRVRRPDGSISRMYLPSAPGGVGGTWTPYFEYDAGNRMIALPGLVTDVTYDLAGNPLETTLANGWRDWRAYNRRSGNVTDLRVYNAGGGVADRTTLAYDQHGRIASRWLKATNATTYYSYDYAGRLLEARDESASDHRFHVGVQSFTYDRAGRMQSNSRIGNYNYSGSPVVFSPATVAGQAMTYDAAGNLIAGRGRTIDYDGENRPIKVVRGNFETRYVYGADGTRLKTIVKDLAAGTEVTTVTFGPVEIRDYGGAAEEVLSYPGGGLRLRNGDLAQAAYAFTDHLDSVRMVVGLDASIQGQIVYSAFGEPRTWVRNAAAPEERKGFIGEKYDAEAGLSFLNARYYDPELCLFTQPDWFDVMKEGVGHNRYAYSLNDPINRLDRGGNQSIARSGGTVRQVYAPNGGFNMTMTPVYNIRGIQLTSQLNVYNYVLGRPMVTASIGNFTPRSLQQVEFQMMNARSAVSFMQPAQVQARMSSLGITNVVCTPQFSSLYTGVTPGGGNIYIGITYNHRLTARTAEHASGPYGLQISPVPGFGSLTRDYARVYEQLSIEAMGGASRTLTFGNGSTLNRINSVNPQYSHRNSTIDTMLGLGSVSVWSSPSTSVPSWSTPF